MPVYIICLFFLFLGGGNNVYAANYHNSTSNFACNLIKRQHIKFTNKDYNTILTEDADLDLLEEENSGANDLKNNIVEFKLYLGKCNFQKISYSLLFKLYFLNAYYNYFKTALSFCNSPIPIYISQRVLRI